MTHGASLVVVPTIAAAVLFAVFGDFGGVVVLVVELVSLMVLGLVLRRGAPRRPPPPWMRQ